MLRKRRIKLRVVGMSDSFPFILLFKKDEDINQVLLVESGAIYEGKTFLI